MSANYYFEKWKKTLITLQELIKLDAEYQATKAHDKNWCDAERRLTGILGKYLFIYNEIADCYQHNLQVQKAVYMIAIGKAVVARILELKEQLRKLVGSEYHFMGHGLVDHKLTTYDILPSDIILIKHQRNEAIKTIVMECIQKAKEKKRNSISISVFEEFVESEEKLSQKLNWWDIDEDLEIAKKNVPKGLNMTAVYDLEKKQEVTIEMLEAKKMVTLIQAHERSRKLIFLLTQAKQKRERWEKELNGTLRDPVRQEIRTRGARLIQQIFRAYFEIKRDRLKARKREEILTMRIHEKIIKKCEKTGIVQMNKAYTEKFNDYEKQRNENFVKLKKEYIEQKHETIEDDIREEIFCWFRKWFDEASFFRDIPKESDGGSILIAKEDVPSPEEWLETYKLYIEKKRANKNKTAYEIKYEKMKTKRENMSQKRADRKKKKIEEQILKKMMKSPKFHPGYYYPQSKLIQHLIKV